MPFKNVPPLYGVWQSMRRRCLTPTYRQWKDYGGRGISICPEWESFERFVEDMGERPAGTSLDRIDNNGNYQPDNCRWATRQEQQRNLRNTRIVSIDGKTYKAIELAELTGLKPDTIVERAAAGLSYRQVTSKKRRRSLQGLALGGKANGARQRARTHCAHGHEFTPSNTYVTKEGWRQCRQCQNAKMRRLNKAKRERLTTSGQGLP